MRSLQLTIAIIIFGVTSGYARDGAVDNPKCAWADERPCLAQSDPLAEPGSQPGHGPRFGERGNFEKRGRKIEILRLAKLLELLALDGDREAQFIVVYRRYRENQHQVRIDRDQTVNELARGLREKNMSQEDIAQRLGQIDELQMREREVINRFHAEIEPLLSVEQMGKLYVFEERFEREVLERMANFRAGRGGMMAPPELNDDSLYPDNDNKSEQ